MGSSSLTRRSRCPALHLTSREISSSPASFGSGNATKTSSSWLAWNRQYRSTFRVSDPSLASDWVSSGGEVCGQYFSVARRTWISQRGRLMSLGRRNSNGRQIKISWMLHYCWRCVRMRRRTLSMCKPSRSWGLQMLVFLLRTSRNVVDLSSCVPEWKTDWMATHSKTQCNLAMQSWLRIWTRWILCKFDNI